MPPEYNAATLNDRYREKLNSLKNDRKTHNINGCREFTNQHLNNEGYEYKVCEAVILFLRHLKEESDYTTFHDNGCKYLYYWLYMHVLNKKQSIKYTLKLYKELHRIYNEYHDSFNTFDKYINEMNEDTSYKLVKLTDMYNDFEKFHERITPPAPKENCTSGVKDLYTKYLDECKNGYDYDFCDELKNFRKKHNFIIQKVLLCKGEQYLLPPVEKPDKVGTTVIPFSLITVTSLILPIMYKFTAFGPWIRRIIGKNKNILEYLNEETNHSLNNYEILDDSSDIPNYNIAYNSS
ncbi:PIR Superfamily Protein [Plasmodium ovale wallikeri]|uniref:PIR Superfamily Protein n=1 Tax=Plasmodium ovale wallikeri TaxID=864142 RepID=A0A1A9ASK1_PLAOA|nr:PIR Superfamily Protein [Plasmodium ovale wallikeri]SBT59099.1 PIR Superfamily Protein [Plasmodium ovale wallikeri]